MATLFLVRHGQASFGADDYDRLSDVGHRQSRLLGEYLADRAVRPVRVMTGTLLRQRQTWEGIAEGLASRGIACAEPLVRPGLDEYRAEHLLEALAATRNQPTVDASAAARPAGAGPVTRAASVAVAGDPADPEVRRAHFRLLRDVLTEWATGRITVAGHRTWDDFREDAVAALLEAWGGPAATVDRGEPADAADRTDAGSTQSTDSTDSTVPRAARRDEDIVVVSSGGPIASILASLLAIPPAGFVGLNLMVRNTGYTELQGNGRMPKLSSFNGIAHLDTPERRSLITYA